MKYDYLIIGAGISGLSSALLLARFGFKVAVVEQAPRPAPLVEGFVRNNVYFETGFHYAGGLEDGGVLDLNLRLLGISDHLQKVPFDLKVYDTVVQPESGLNFSFPQGYAALGDALREHFPTQRQALSEYFERIQQITRKLPYYCFPEPVKPEDLGESSASGLSLLHEYNLAQVLDELAIGGELRTLLQIHCLLHGSLPSEVPFAIHAGVVDGYYRSAHTFKGGGRALVTALVTVLKQCGVDLFCRHRVEEIELSAAGAFAGVRCTNGVKLQASGCISTLHPQAMLKLLPASVFRPVYRRRLAALKESPGAEIVFLRRERKRGSTLGVRCERQRGITPRVDSLPVHNFQGRNFFFLPGSGKAMFDPDLPLSERLLYLNFAGSAGSDASDNNWEGGVTAILPAPYYEPGTEVSATLSYAERKAQTGELVRKRIIELLPELGPGLEVECVATGKTLQRINASAHGSLYGVKHMVGQFNPSAKTRLPGLFLAGQATAAPGLLGAITSALITVGGIVGHDRVEALRRDTAGL
ncbi:MAG: NAD(P)/FAD-dependent oxidoreductase [Deltaproteobacteria bacterium]|nr:NAD(P)/FAD-dependent oxidoreductase [Candidatus Tharpella aukensis]